MPQAEKRIAKNLILKPKKIDGWSTELSNDVILHELIIYIWDEIFCQMWGKNINNHVGGSTTMMLLST